jgi:hypothetical protein
VAVAANVCAGTGILHMPPTDRENSERAQRIQRIVDECIARQVSGQAISYQKLIAEHPDLMPELGEALHKLELIDRARQRAREANDTG